MFIPWKIPVIDGDELEEILALPLAGHVDHHGARGHAVGRQARHEGLQGLQLGGAGQHSGFKCLKYVGWFNKCLFQMEQMMVLGWQKTCEWLSSAEAAQNMAT